MQNRTDPHSASSQTAETPLALPNFLYLGPAKSGSTWTFNVLSHHPDVYMFPGKGLYYFSSHYERGQSWYLQFYQKAGDFPIRGEVSHNYLASREACDRIYALNPQMKLMACLRDPVDRAFSAYLDGVKNGRFAPDTPFDEAMVLDPTIVNHGRYATHLKPYLETFGSGQLHVTLFDDLAETPQDFADRLCDFLEIPHLQLDTNLATKMMPAGTPRFRPLVRAAKATSKLALRLGLRGFRGRIKRSRWIRNLLYIPFDTSKAPRMAPNVRDHLRELFQEEVREVDRLFSLGLVQRWKY